MTSDPEALARLALELVAVPSVTGDEEALADLVEARCRALPASRSSGSATRSWRASASPATPWRWSATSTRCRPGRATRPRLEGTRVIGRGAADMKGGDAAILAVLERCARSGAPVVCVFYDREEGPNRENGIHARAGRFELLGRPPSRSSASRRAATCTPAASASSTPISSSAAARAQRAAVGGRQRDLRAVPFLERAAARRAAPGRGRGPHVPRHALHHPDPRRRRAQRRARRVELALNVRFAPGREAAAARAEVEALVAGEGELTWLDESPAAPPRLTEPVLAQFLAETGVRVLPKQAWTDVATLQAHGIPAVNYGPGEAQQAHQPDEWVDGEAIAARGLDARPLPAASLIVPWAMQRREMAGARQPLPARRGAALADHAGACAAALRRRARARRRRRARARAGRRRASRVRRAQPRRLDRRGLRQRHAHGGRASRPSASGAATCGCARARATGEAARPAPTAARGAPGQAALDGPQ